VTAVPRCWGCVDEKNPNVDKIEPMRAVMNAIRPMVQLGEEGFVGGFVSEVVENEVGGSSVGELSTV
jgi:hypothetical protein